MPKHWEHHGEGKDWPCSSLFWPMTLQALVCCSALHLRHKPPKTTNSYLSEYSLFNNGQIHNSLSSSLLVIQYMDEMKIHFQISNGSLMSSLECASGWYQDLPTTHWPTPSQPATQPTQQPKQTIKQTNQQTNPSLKQIIKQTQQHTTTFATAS